MTLELLATFSSSGPKQNRRLSTYSLMIHPFTKTKLGKKGTVLAFANARTVPFLFFKRSWRDLNPRAGYPTYSLSRRAPSAAWVQLQNSHFMPFPRCFCNPLSAGGFPHYDLPAILNK